MSKSAESSTSRIAMSLAFKRARRKFPKNYGLPYNSEETYQTFENEELSLSNIQESPINLEINEKSMSNPIEELLVDSLQEVEISDDVKTLCGNCQCYSNHLEHIAQDGSSVLNTNIKKNYSQHLLQNNLSDTSNCQSLPKSSKPNYLFYENQRSLYLNENEESNFYDKMNNIKKNEASSALNYWNPKKKLNVIDSKCNVGEIFQIPQILYEPHESLSRRKKHRCKKCSQSYIRHSSSHCTLSDDACNKNVMSHSPDCFFHNYCSYNYHCYRHYCYPSHCCCFNCCLNWRDCYSKSVHIEEPPTSTHKRSTNHRVKRDKCTACKRYSSGSEISLRQANSCSCDSSIFTNIHYENVDYDEDEISGSSPNILLHRNSYTILKE